MDMGTLRGETCLPRPTVLPPSWRFAIDRVLRPGAPASAGDRWLLVLFWRDGCRFTIQQMRQLAVIRADPKLRYLDVVAVAEPGVRTVAEARSMLRHRSKRAPHRGWGA